MRQQKGGASRSRKHALQADRSRRWWSRRSPGMPSRAAGGSASPAKSCWMTLCASWAIAISSERSQRSPVPAEGIREGASTLARSASTWRDDSEHAQAHDDSHALGRAGRLRRRRDRRCWPFLPRKSLWRVGVRLRASSPTARQAYGGALDQRANRQGRLIEVGTGRSDCRAPWRWPCRAPSRPDIRPSPSRPRSPGRVSRAHLISARSPWCRSHYRRRRENISDALSKEWARLVRSLKLPDVTLHACRHTHASQLIAAGVDIVTVSRRLGHGNPSITLTVYAHLFSNTDERAADVVEAAFASTLAD